MKFLNYPSSKQLPLIPSSKQLPLINVCIKNLVLVQALVKTSNENIFILKFGILSPSSYLRNVHSDIQTNRNECRINIWSNHVMRGV